MLRRLENLLDAVHLDDTALLHHRDIVGELAHDRQIMGDEQHRHAVARLQILQKREDLRLDCDVERRGRLVGDEEIGPVGERHGDHHALTLAARELMRIGGKTMRRIGNADLGEQIDDPVSQRWTFARAMQFEDLADLPLDRMQRD